MITAKNKLALTLFLTISITLCFHLKAGAQDNEFSRKLYSVKWIAYSPTNFNPDKGLYPPLISIEQDLKVLKGAGFTGIITYGSTGTLSSIPEIAKNLGFEGVIMGIWDIRDNQELSAAIESRDYVDGYCVGNEGLGRRYEIEELISVMDYVRQMSVKPITTAEEIMDYANDKIVKLGDWVFPNVHPFLLNIKEPQKAANGIKHYFKIISRAAKGKPVLFKEVGYPTNGDAFANQRNQRKFFLLMEDSFVNFSYFEGFDQYWKNSLEVEPHWGLFDKNRRPKKFIKSGIRR